ncbi:MULTISPECIES: hypothetical protein [unclassified Myroides]|uniref:hypothetical protein n=1 Tax=unclassified Myroides TaxID=2642485 RepID=UPI002577F8CB|nr:MULTISPECIES: hypothetical protein [unclassified Myroides]
MDPLAEDFPGWNPYHYVHNNPVNLVDPTGMSADGWVKSEKKNGESTYTYDETINSQEDADKSYPGMKKQYLGESFTLIGKIAKKVAYQYNFQGKNVTDGNGNKVDLTTNVKTEGGTTIMNPANTGGVFAGFTVGGAVGGGIGFTLGLVADNFGDKGIYFSFNGYSGVGGGSGITAGVVSPTNTQTFGINDFNGMGNSINLGVSLGPIGAGFETGGTQGNGFFDYGNRTDSQSRPYLYNRAGQSSQYPAIDVGFKSVRIGGTISSSKTWVWKL